jgi:hypothetical protein
MNPINWRLAVLPDLAQSAAPRVLRTQTLYEMIAVHRPHVAKATIRSVVRDLVTISAVREIHSDIFLNLRCSPPAVLAEAANHLRKQAIVSLQYVLHEAGVIRHRSNNITAVLPNTHLHLCDREHIFAGQESFTFSVLPSECFPPLLADEGDVIDIAKPYPSFTPEKALLDWLYLEKSRNVELPEVSEFDLEKLNIQRLFALATRMKLRYLLERFLNPPTTTTPALPNIEPASSSTVTDHDIGRIPRLLNSLREVWEFNPELSFGQILAQMYPRGSGNALFDVKDAEWEENLTSLQLAMTKGLKPITYSLKEKSATA